MPRYHPFWDLINHPDPLTQDEHNIVSAVINLSSSMFKKYSLEEIYDILQDAKAEHSFTGDKPSVIKQLKRLEEIMSTTSDAVSRVQKDSDAMKAVLTTMQTALANSLKAQDDLNARFAADIAALRNNMGSGDPVALGAIADSMEETAKGFQSVTDALNTAAATDATLEQPPAPAPVPATPAP